MKKALILLFLAIGVALPGRAAPASTDSVDKLLVLSKADKIRDQIIAQMNKGMGMGIRQMLQGKTPTAADQVVIDGLRQQMTTIVGDALSWPKLKSMYEQAYAATFSQEEIDGLIAFYSSPTGQAFADKQPLLTQQVNVFMSQQMGPLVMKIQSAMQDAMQKLQAAHTADDQAPAAAPADAAVAAQDQHAKGLVPIHISHGQQVALKDYLVPGKTTVFDFYSKYCPPCMELSPLMEQLHKGRADISVVEVDINRPGVTGIDWQSPVAQQYKLDSIPHLAVYNPDGTLKSEGDPARELVMGWIVALGK